MSGRRVLVVGGGVAGLAAARAALLAAEEAGGALEVTLAEAGDRLGGKVLTAAATDGTPLEMGPDGFLVMKPETERLARELGLGDELVGTGPDAGRAYLWLRGRLRPLPRGLVLGVPAGLGPLLGAVRSGIVPPLSALRAGLEPVIPRERSRDAPVTDVARRRLGKGVADRLVAPLVEGVFGGPAGEVSFEVALPQFAGSRSLLLGQLRRPRAAAGGGSPFRTLRRGLSSLVDALRDDVVARGARVETGRAVVAADVEAAAAAGAVVLAVPAPAAAALLRTVAPEAAGPLGSIAFRPSAIAWTRYRRGAVRQQLDGSGYLAAPEERRTVVACSWVATKWPHLAGDDVWLRSVVTSADRLAMDDDALGAAVADDLAETMGAGSGPEEVRLHRWAPALPVYAPGHARRVAAAEAALPPTVAVAGASYRGVGLSDCIRSGQEAGRRVAALLSGA